MLPASIAAGSALLGMSAATYAVAVTKYRNNLDNSAKEAIAEAAKFEVPDEPKSGLRVSALNKSHGKEDVFEENAKPADQITLVMGGFSGSGGRAGDYFAGQLHSEFKDHHLVGIENPEFDTKNSILNKKTPVKDLAKTMIEDNFAKGKNPSAIRMAAQAYAYHKKTGKPINLVGYSGGGMVTNEAMELLKRMGVKDVKAVTVASPSFGVVPISRNTINLLSKNDLAYNIPGFRTKNTVFVHSVAHHVKYFKDELPDRANVDNLDPVNSKAKPNAEVMGILKNHFKRAA